MKENRQQPASDKRALLTNLLSGKAGKKELADHRQQQQPTYMVVCSHGHPGPDDLVEVRGADNQLQQIPFSEFEADPITYKRFCITVD